MKAFGQVIPMHKGEGITQVVLAASKAPRRSRWLVPVVVAAGVHVAMAVSLSFEDSGETWALSTAARVRMLMAEREARPVELPLPPPEPAKPTPTAPSPEPTRAPTVPRPSLGRPKAQAPAQAGQVVASVPDPSQPVDFGEAFVVGGGTVYAGGTTSASGTAKQKVDGPVSPAPTAPKPAARAVDHSRSIALADPDWTCPWPREADDTDIDEQVAVVKVEVDADGRCRRVSVVRDPGHGFGAQAARCAQEATFLPARDMHGIATTGTAAIRVRFVR